MKKGLQLRRVLQIAISCLMLVIFFTLNSFAGEAEEVAWSSILPEDNNISFQQQRVINSLEATLIELDSVITKNIHEGKISDDTDFTQDKDVSLVYDYLVYHVYEIMKVDRKIREEFALQESSFGKVTEASDVVKQFHIIKTDYEKKGKNFFSSLDGLKRAILVKDLKAKAKDLKSTIGELRSVMNLYSSYRIAIATR
ncbi:MAG: hypothetical protein A2Z47_13570 [Thermodesulfovibrio sp. RBG_19FT_COMBO_42_12]|nr:MAG: hypothetical protein A2Z47_13570 [Thermodesulfovibrio sp. RBG_19FT_COMBO_42_12]